MRELPEGWIETTLGEVIELIIDHRGKTPKKLGGDWATSGYRAISAKTIKNGVLVNEEKMNILPENLYRKWMKVEVEYGDVFLTSEAPLGEHLIWKSDEKVVLSQRIYGIRTNKEILNPFYFNYFLDGDYFQHELKSRESGSTVTGIKQSELVKTKVIIPPLPEQKAIAAMLSSFDEKIELLREQNKTLETLAQTIFKEWFVHFNFPDPHGKPYRNNGGEMVESELGEIPQGWRVGGIRCLVDHVKKNIKPFAYPERAYQHYSLPAFDSGKQPEKHNGSEISSNKYAVVENCFLVSKLNPSTPRIWAILNPLENSVCSTEFQVIKPNNYDSFGFVYGVLTSYGLRRELSARAHGTSSSHQRVSPADILDAPVALPSDELIKQYSIVVNEMLEKIDNNQFQIQTLSKTRDTLLPKLMSGQVRVQGVHDDS